MNVNAAAQAPEPDYAVPRRNFLLKGLEFAACLPLVGILWQRWQGARTYSTVKADHAMTKQTFGSMEQFKTIHSGFSNALENLARAYDAAYYTTELEYVPQIDMDGNMGFGWENRTDWREPSNVPNHNIVYGWRNAQRSLDSKCAVMNENPMVDETKARDIFVDEAKMNKTVQGILSVLLYGGQIYLLLQYEEHFAQMNYSGPKAKTQQKVKSMNTEHQMKRRNFLKMGAALAGAGVANKFQNKQEEMNGKHNIELRNGVEEAVNPLYYGREKSFEKYFERSPAQMIADVGGVVNTLSETLKVDVESEKVRVAMQNVVDEGTIMSANLENHFTQGIPEDLDKAARIGLATQKIEALKRDDMGKGTGMFFLEALVIAATVGVVVGAGELGSYHLRDRPIFQRDS